MSPRPRWITVFIGSEPRMQRMLRYWAATWLLYSLAMLLMFGLIDGGIVDATAGTPLIRFGMTSIFGCYLLIRASDALSLRPAQLAVLQSLLALTCNVGAYALLGPVRGASLMVLLVIMVFSTFSLRTRATLTLCLVASVELAVTMLWMAAAHPDRYPGRIEAVHFGLTVASLLAVSLLTGEMHKLRVRLKRQKEELLVAVATIRTLATIDELTALANRRHMNDVLAAQEQRKGTPVNRTCIALLDLDFFKNINDRYGHAGGDAVLRAFAAAARAELRADDVLARWGGEEFLLMLPDTELSTAAAVVGRIADKVGAMRIDELDRALTITFSAGVVERCPGEPFTDTISRADRAMYVAKSSGRNRIVPERVGSAVAAAA
ncbi:diguanylate cyclase [Massilia sp. DWR3-1-1]|uniref:diguanylate cyclase n=1 Tax=Massilia sp. DWR3-1-1 TaxID=2804559 RepID=UPI003CF08143